MLPRGALEVILPAHLQTSPWFAGTGRRVLAVRIVEVVAVPHETTQSYATFLRVDYADGEPETYLLPLAFAASRSHAGTGTIRRTRSSPEVRRTDELSSRGSARRRNADLRSSYGTPERHCRWRQPPEGCRLEKSWQRAPLHCSQIGGPAPTELRPVIAEVEQNHTSVVYSEQLVLKLFRRLEAGIHPEVEIGRMLTEQGFPHTPPLSAPSRTTRAAASRPRWRSCTASCPTKAMPGNTPSLPCVATTSGCRQTALRRPRWCRTRTRCWSWLSATCKQRSRS